MQGLYTTQDEETVQRAFMALPPFRRLPPIKLLYVILQKPLATLKTTYRTLSSMDQ